MKNTSSTNSRLRGFTLVEGLVTVAICAMFFSLLYGMFLPVLAVASAGSAKTDTLGPASFALYQLESDLRVGTTSGISVGAPSSIATPAPPPFSTTNETVTLAVETPQTYTGSGDRWNDYVYDPTSGLPMFESYVVYTLVPASAGGPCDITHPCNLWRTTIANPAPSKAAQPISQSLLTAALSTITTTGRVMARNVLSFEVANAVVPCAQCLYGSPRPEVDIEFAISSTDENGKPSQTAFQTEIFVRNS